MASAAEAELRPGLFSWDSHNSAESTHICLRQFPKKKNKKNRALTVSKPLIMLCYLPQPTGLSVNKNSVK
jgi:hypothetical protein